MTESKKRRIEITIETRSVTIIRTGSSKTDLVNCRHCGMAVPVFTDANASLVFRIDTGTLALITGNGQVHPADDDHLCGNSLAAYFKQEIRYIEN